MTENERRLHRSAELAKLMIDRSLAAVVGNEKGLAVDFSADLAHHLERAIEAAHDIRKERIQMQMIRAVGETMQKPESD
jgi:enolase